MEYSRRRFLKIGSIALATIPFARNLLAADPAPAAGAALPLAKETDAMAKSLKYCANADKPTASCPERKKKERKDQFCHNCQLYTKVSGDAHNEIGKCLLMPKNTVGHHGWCMSWVKKPGV